MAKATKRISRTRATSKLLPKFAATPTAREFLARERRTLANVGRHTRALPDDAPRKAYRDAAQAVLAARADNTAYVAEYLSRFYADDNWARPRPLKTRDDVVELAVAGIENAGAARALCIAIARSAGLRL